MRASNQFSIEGHLGSTPTTKSTKADKALTFLSVAVSNDYYDESKGEWVKQDPTWLDVTCFGDTARKAAELSKGAKVLVRGQLTTRKQEIETTDGVKSYTFMSLRAGSVQELAQKTTEAD